jgi:hypothetical protein
VKIIPLIFIAFLLAGSVFTSCKQHITAPPTDTTKKKCDTCCDTCHKPPCDTCNKPCDTCNINKDSAAHAFTWQQLTIPSEANLTGVWVFGANDMIIVGNSLWHYDGANFTKISATDATYHVTMNGGLSGNNIFAFSNTDFWMVHVSLAYHTSDGTNFDDLRFGPVNACWGLSSNDMFFVGNSGHIYHYNGTKFDTMTSNTTKDLGIIWGTSDHNISTCYTNSQTGVISFLHYDGNEWKEDPFINTPGVQFSGLGGVWAVDSSGHEFTVAAGAYVFRKTDNGIWRKDSYVPNKLPDSTYIFTGGLRGNTANDFWDAAGYAGWAGHWNGKTWKRADTLYSPTSVSNNYYFSGIAVNGNTICIVGSKDGGSLVEIGTRKQ